MIETLIEIVELLIIPVVVLAVMTLAEQKIEPIDYSMRFIKTAWDTQIFAVGAQCGFVFRQSLHGTLNHVMTALTYLAFILFFTAILGNIRLKLHHYLPTNNASDTNFHVTWLALVAICIPIEYLVLLGHS